MVDMGICRVSWGRVFGRILAGFVAATLVWGSSAARAESVGSTLVIDANNGRVLLSKEAEKQRFPASLTKMMTLYLVFEALDVGALKLDTPMKVSAFAASRPPTKLGLRTGSTLLVREAIPALITRSANDAAEVIAEHLGGSEAHFAEMMTAKARQLGMSQTTFKSPHGLPDPGNVSSAADMAKLALALREHFPERYENFQIKSFSFRGTTIPSHNNLLKRSAIYDGIKTGYTNASGFNIVTSVSSEGKRLLVIVFGGRTARSRDDYVASLVQAYLPKASTERTGPLVAAFSPNFKGVAVRTHVAALPASIPYPTSKPDLTASRIAAAFEADAGRTAGQSAGQNGREDLVRAAILQALTSEHRARAEQPSLAAMRALTRTGPQPTGAANGTWDVQIGAMPSATTARQMLAEVQARLPAKVWGPSSPVAQEMPNEGRALYRARFVGFASKAQADDACAAIRHVAYTCYTVASTD